MDPSSAEDLAEVEAAIQPRHAGLAVTAESVQKMAAANIARLIRRPQSAARPDVARPIGSEQPFAAALQLTGFSEEDIGEQAVDASFGGVDAFFGRD